MSEDYGRYLLVGSYRKGGVVLPTQYKEVDVSRRNPILGNPYPMMDSSEGERLRVIEAFRKTLWEDFKRRGPMFHACVDLAKRVQSGESIALHCWCAPLPCHADVIRSAVLWLCGQAGESFTYH